MIYLIIITLVMFLFLVLNFIIPHIVKTLWKRRFLNSVQKSGKIFLTFDDGPDPINTVRILDLLKKYNIKATFFVIGENALNYNELIGRMVAEEHKICLHGNNHLHPWKVFPWQAMYDLNRCKKILISYGIRNKYARPPFGKLNIFTMFYFWFSHLIFVHWNIDSLDYKRTDSKQLGEWLKQRIEVGKIILLHDGRRAGTSAGEITAEGLKIFFNDCRFDSQVFSTLP